MLNALLKRKIERKCYATKGTALRTLKVARAEAKTCQVPTGEAIHEATCMSRHDTILKPTQSSTAAAFALVAKSRRHPSLPSDKVPAKSTKAILRVKAAALSAFFLQYSDNQSKRRHCQAVRQVCCAPTLALDLLPPLLIPQGLRSTSVWGSALVAI